MVVEKTGHLAPPPPSPGNGPAVPGGMMPVEFLDQYIGAKYFKPPWYGYAITSRPDSFIVFDQAGTPIATWAFNTGAVGAWMAAGQFIAQCNCMDQIARAMGAKGCDCIGP